jgi:hypothetical protein
LDFLHSRILADQSSDLGCLQVALHFRFDQPELALEASDKAKAPFVLSMIAKAVDKKAFLSDVESFGFRCC